MTTISDEPACSRCGVAIAEHPKTDDCAIAQEASSAEDDEDDAPRDHAPLRAKVSTAKDQLDLALRCLYASDENGDRWFNEAIGELRRLTDTLGSVSRSVSYL